MQMQKIPLEQIMEISLDEYIQLMKKSGGGGGGGLGDGSGGGGGGVVGSTTSTPMMVDGPNSTNKSENQLVFKSKLQKLMDLPKPTSQQWRFMSPNTPNNPVGMPPLISIESHNLYENKFAANRNWSMNKLNNYFQQNKTKSKNKRRNRKRINNNQGMQHQFQNNIKNNNNNNNNNNKQFNGIRNGYNKQQNGNQNRSNNGQRFRKSVQSRLTLFQNNEEDAILGTNLYNNNQNQQNYNNNNNNLLSMRRNSFNNFKSNSINGLNNIDDDDDDDAINQLAMTNGGGGGGGKKMSVTNPMTTIAKHNNNNNNNNNNGLKTTDQLSTINFDKHLVTTLAAKIVHQMNNVQKNEQIHKSKYDMKIQKEISDIQGKTLFFKCPGASVVSFDGPGIDAYLTTPDATEITMNQRFS